MYKNGRTDINDDYLAGRPSTATTIENVVGVNEIIESNQRIRVNEIAQTIGISFSSAHEMITERLKYRKVCTRWVLRLLIDEQKNRHLQSSIAFLTRYENEENEYLDKIVTGDKTWFHYFYLKSKRNFNEWKRTNSPLTQKAKIITYAGKVMLTPFFDNQDVVFSEFMQKSSTIYSATYCETLIKLRKTIKDDGLEN